MLHVLNSKHEIRNPKQIPKIRKIQNSKREKYFLFWYLNLEFGFVCFGFRASDFEFKFTSAPLKI